MAERDATPTGRALRVVCADDEPMARETLRSLVAADPGLELVALCTDGDEAVSAIERERPDLVVLDVRMPGRSGLEVVEALPEDARPLVVFATAHDDHAVSAFELHAVDYLLKPFDDRRFEMALDRARNRLAREGPEAGRARLERLVNDEDASRLAIHREGRVELVDAAEIEWIEAADQYVNLHLRDGREELMRASLTQLERSLDPSRFLRVHRSALVALDRVRSLESAGAGTGRVRLASGAVAPVSRTRMALVRRRLR